MKFTFGSAQRLKSRKIIDHLFKDGKVIAVYPLRLVWIPAELPEGVGTQFGVTVSKRNFKNAVDRNRIKRQLREAIRLNQHLLKVPDGMKQPKLALMVIYTARKQEEYRFIEEKMVEAFEKLHRIL